MLICLWFCKRCSLPELPKSNGTNEINMYLSQLFLAAGLSIVALAADCRPGVQWSLEPNDCICMRSSTGELLSQQTNSICASMKYRTFEGVCMVDKDMRQEFKDRCKALNQESVIGHCR